MNCVNCNSDFSLHSSLEAAKFSWPNLRAFWDECSDCKSGNHIRISDGRYQQIEIISAPGLEWKAVNTFQEKNLSYKKDESYLQVWFNDKHYEIKART